MVELAVPVGEGKLMADQFRKQNQHVIRIPLCRAAEQKSVRCDETGIEHQIGREAALGKQPQPGNGRLHIDVRRLCQIRGSRRKQDRIRDASQVSDHYPRVFIRNMLQDLNTSDQVEPSVDRIRERRLAAVCLHVHSDFADRVFGKINPVGLNAPLPQRLDEEAFGASGIEDATRLQRAHDMVGHAVEECQPEVVPFVWNAAAAVLVIVFVVPRCDRFWIRRGVHWLP